APTIASTANNTVQVADSGVMLTGGSVTTSTSGVVSSYNGFVIPAVTGGGSFTLAPVSLGNTNNYTVTLPYENGFAVIAPTGSSAANIPTAGSGTPYSNTNPIPANYLGSGTPTSSTCLLGNQTWGACGSGGGGTGTSSGYSSGTPLAAFSSSTNISPATYTNVVGLFGSGTCSGYLKSDGTCATPSGGSSLWFAAGTDSGTASAYQVTTTMASYAAGNAECFNATHINNASPTVQFGALGAISIVLPNGAGVPAALIQVGPPATCVVYDGTNFDLLTPQKYTGESGSALPVWSVNPKITAPSIITGVNDTNGNTMIGFTPTASAVDSVSVTNAATGNPATVTLGINGTDANVNLNLVSKGTGTVQVNGVKV